MMRDIKEIQIECIALSFRHPIFHADSMQGVVSGALCCI